MVINDDNDDHHFNFEKSFSHGFDIFGSDDLFEGSFNRSEQYFQLACSIIEEAEDWGVSNWREAANWTVTGMVDTVNLQFSNYWEEPGEEVDFTPCHGSETRRKIRQKNRYHYKFGDLLTAPFYTSFLAPGFGQFRAWFCLPLHLIEEIAERFISEGYVHATRRIHDLTLLHAKAELIVLGCLNVLAHGTPFRCLPLNTHIFQSDHQLYFQKFFEMFSLNRNEYIYLPRNKDELQEVMERYHGVVLPGAMGSIDVVHCKWS